MATLKPRYSITLDEKMFQEIEDFRFQHRFQTRNQATVELIRLGLEALRQQEAAGTFQRRDQKKQAASEPSGKV